MQSNYPTWLFWVFSTSEGPLEAQAEKEAFDEQAQCSKQ